MTTATADMEAINAFEMPEVRRGATVLYYSSGLRDRHQSIGTVMRVGARSVMVKTAEGHIKEAVRHIDDPKLTLNSDQRESGAWDFTEDYVFIRTLDERVTALEQGVTPSVKDEKLKQGLAVARDLLASGMSIDEVCPKVRCYGWKYDELKDALESDD